MVVLSVLLYTIICLLLVLLVVLLVALLLFSFQKAAVATGAAHVTRGNAAAAVWRCWFLS